MTAPVSVVMAVYNGRRYLREQLQSVVTQLDADDELVIVDDGSTDGSATLIRELDCPRIRLFVNSGNLGARQTFERALRLAQNEFVFLCDQDDVWLPGKKAAFLAAFLRDPEVRVVISDAELIDGEGKVLSRSYMTSHRGGFDGSVLGTLYRNRYLGCAMAVRRSLLPIALPIPSGSPQHDMWLGALGKLSGRIAYLSVPYLQYRRHGGNLSPLGSNSWPRMVAWRVSLLVALVRRKLAIFLGLHRDSLAT